MSGKPSRRFARWAAILLLTPVAVFMLSAWIGAAIPRNSGWVEPSPAEEDAVTIFLGTNGIHTDIVMPIVSETVDWRDHFPLSDIKASEAPYTHISVSWGERSFFLETPTWSELNPLTALGAMTGGDALLHTAYYNRPKASESRREVHIRPEEYAKLAKSIAADLNPPESRKLYPGYGPYDAFYSARGIYHLANTCNQWTSDQLAGAGIKTGWWTPFPGGVMQWAEPPPDN